MADANIVERARVALAFIETFDTAALATVGGEFSLAEGISDAIELKRLFSGLRVEALARLPDASLNAVLRPLSRSVDMLKRAQNFRPTSSQNPTVERAEILKDLKHAWEEALNSAALELTTALVQSIDITAMTKDLRDVAVAMDMVKQKAEETVQESMGTLANVRALAGQVTVANEATRFIEEAKSYQAAARRWLSASVSMALLTGGFALFSQWILRSHRLHGQ